MPSMDTPFLTIAEAAEKTGRSASTIRRLIKTISDDDSHPDRTSVEPTTKQVAVFKKKGDNFTWKIKEDIIIRNFGSAPVEDKKKKAEPVGDIFSILQHELSLKNAQIEKQWEVIHALNDRLREGNMLMGSLQKRLSLPEPQSPAATVVEASTVEPSKEPVAAASNTKKRGLFGWIKR